MAEGTYNQEYIDMAELKATELLAKNPKARNIKVLSDCTITINPKYNSSANCIDIIVRVTTKKSYTEIVKWDVTLLQGDTITIEGMRYIQEVKIPTLMERILSLGKEK